MSDIRFQDCPWHVRLWRRRHQITVPVDGLRFWLAERNGTGTGLGMGLCRCLSVANGFAQARMNWVYDLDEVLEMVGELDE